jgi:N-acetylglucosaminyl-diphospho-decaprenol L-rhamnosyltransferase
MAAVVVNWNAAEELPKAVASLEAEGVAQIVVVDNASSDDSEARLTTTHPEARWLQTGANLGYGGGANRGAAVTDSELILVCNADVRVAPGAVAALAAAFDADGKLGMAGPRIENTDGTLYPSVRSFPSVKDAVGHALFGFVFPNNPFSRRYKMLDWDHSEARRVDWISGCCFVARRSMWDELHGFDESYFMYAEDVDLCWRAHKAGWEVAYEPAATAVHVQGVSTDQTPYRMIFSHHRALLRFHWRSTEGPERLLVPVLAVGVIGRAVVAMGHRWLVGRRPHRPVPDR